MGKRWAGPGWVGRRGAVLLGLLAVACSPPSSQPVPGVALHEPRYPVALIGWDGADWEVAAPLLEAGRMPHLASLRARGAWGDLQTLPPALSPLLWTSLATGRPAEVHGVLDFLESDAGSGEPRPVGASARRSPALWEMAGAGGLRAGVVGWWATHPAVPVNGFLVSDRLAYTVLEGFDDPGSGALGGVPGEVVFPPDREPELRAAVAAAMTRGRRQAATLRGPEPGPPAAEQQLAGILGACLAYHDALQRLLRDGQPDLLMFYTGAIDQAAHRFMDCTAPATRTCPPEEREPYADTVAAVYQRLDALLGEILAALRPDTVVVLVSDHGFLSGSQRPEFLRPHVHGQPGRWHRPQGMIALAGPPVRPGPLPSVELLDVPPTVLSLLGLPRDGEMEGSVVEAALEPSFLGALPEPALESWAALLPRPEVSPGPAAVPGDERRLRELRALGYLGAGGAKPAAPVDGSSRRTVAAEVNLAERLLHRGEAEAAAAAARRALARSPEYGPAHLALAEAEGRRGNGPEAAAAFARAVHAQGGSRADPAILLRWALATGGTAPDPQAMEALQRALVERPEAADLWAARGVLRSAAGEGGEAIQDLLQATSRRPAHPEALAALLALGEAGAPGIDRARLLSRARAADPGALLPRNWQALDLAAAGRVEEAERLLRETAALSPGHAGTRINLGNLLARQGRLADAEEEFRRAVAAAPGEVAACVGLAATLARLGRPADAREVLEGSPDPARHDPRLLRTLGLVYRDLGDLPRAAAALRESLAVEPAQPEVAAALRALEQGR